MSARDVADMLAVAHEGRLLATASMDTDLMRDCNELALLAMAHPDAGTFFSGLQVALGETYRDDNNQDEDDLPSNGEIRRGTVNTRSPVDAGSLPHDGVHREEDRLHAEQLSPSRSHADMITRHRADPDSATNHLRRRAVRNL